METAAVLERELKLAIIFQEETWQQEEMDSG